jgi:hypothetical protein
MESFLLKTWMILETDHLFNKIVNCNENILLNGQWFLLQRIC